MAKQPALEKLLHAKIHDLNCCRFHWWPHCASHCWQLPYSQSKPGSRVDDDACDKMLAACQAQSAWERPHVLQQACVQTVTAAPHPASLSPSPKHAQPTRSVRPLSSRQAHRVYCFLTVVVQTETVHPSTSKYAALFSAQVLCLQRPSHQTHPTCHCHAPAGL
jgi:hypothetical protein